MHEQFHEYVGIIHIHSTYSDGSQSIQEIAKVARDLSLDFLMFTDHNTLQAKRDRLEGWHSGVLVMVGYEINDENKAELIEKNYIIENSTPLPGMLFNMPAIGIKEQRQEQKRTIKERCEKTAELANTKNSVLIWCNLNKEGELLEKLIPDSLQVAGKHKNEIKEERLLMAAALPAESASNTTTASFA